MRLFTNLPIALKILAALGLMTVLAIVIAAGSIRELDRLNAVTQKLAKEDAHSLYLAISSNEKMTRTQDGSGYGIYAQRYTVPSPPPARSIFQTGTRRD